MTENFILYSHQPTSEFIAALEANNIKVRGWSYSYSRWKNKNQTLKTEHGWRDPNDKYGNLKLTAADSSDAWNKARKLGKQHGIDVHPGLMISE